ncbi:hypothetical protein K505DRAFT_43132 [Melanomma pulvis-pyrius CBS 109.77]|uniref:Uncharacterized protein n=1 Tax=Melanomma pulvis-pyrius CBS 109.77 TaxID=1314802 RepID=A0A6A6XXN2_9PLEO|nr:hypothetical protein K505DRAFT_43132 [Melanomma pulvis-pyrius CBS 109.77]
MCYTEDVFHRPCRHWGRERFVGGPCCRSRIVNGRHTGCGYAEKIGSVNSNELCSNCKFRQARGGGWKPFANVSNDGWARVEEKIRQRSLGSEDFLYVQSGECASSTSKLHTYHTCRYAYSSVQRQAMVRLLGEMVAVSLLRLK